MATLKLALGLLQLLSPLVTAQRPPGYTNQCPGSAPGTLITDSAGTPYNIYCNNDFGGTVAVVNGITTFDGCMLQCDGNPDCGAVVWDRAETCYLKPPVSNYFGVEPGTAFVAVRVGAGAPSTVSAPAPTTTAPPTYTGPPLAACPASNGTIFTDVNGISYEIACGYDTKGWNYPINFYSDTTFGYQECFAACDGRVGCLGFTWIGWEGAVNGVGIGQCYFKLQAVDCAPVIFWSEGGLRDILVSGLRTDQEELIEGNCVPPPVTTYTATAPSTTSATSLAPIATNPAVACTAPSGTTVIYASAAYEYSVQCQSALIGVVFLTPTFTAVNSFTDCFQYCDADVACSGFDFQGVDNGAGPGRCYLQTANTGLGIAIGFVLGPTAGYVAAIKGRALALVSSLPGPPPSYVGAVTTTTAFSTTSSLSLPGPPPSYGGDVTTTTVTTTTSSSVAASSTAAACLVTGPTTYTSGNYEYTVECGTQLSGGVFLPPAYTATNSFTDCLQYCNSLATCAGINYQGADNGLGQGTCYLQSVGPTPLTVNRGLASGNIGCIKSRLVVPISTTSSASSAIAIPTGGTTPNGFCGRQYNFYTCGAPFGPCCSQYGTCGSTDDYCGVGCQLSYGTCGTAVSSSISSSLSSWSSSAVSSLSSSISSASSSLSSAIFSASSSLSSSSSSSSSAISTPTGGITPNGYCGPQYNYYTCAPPFGSCCSQYGSCGDSDEYCGVGCLLSYGTCSPAASSSAASSASSASSSQSSVASSLASSLSSAFSSASSVYASSRTTTTTSSAAFPSQSLPSGIPSGIPSCVLGCIVNSDLGGCDTTDAYCVCNNDALISEFSCCIAQSCDTQGEIDAISTMAQELCACYGVFDLPTEPTCAPIAAPVAYNQTLSTDGRCGPQSRQACTGSSFGDCCSIYGSCGNSSDYCNAEVCNPLYGTCDQFIGAQVPSQDGRCGNVLGVGFNCADTVFGDCCSAFGYCGNTTEYCASDVCLPEFGNCNAPTASGVPTTTGNVPATTASACSGILTSIQTQIPPLTSVRTSNTGIPAYTPPPTLSVSASTTRAITSEELPEPTSLPECAQSCITNYVDSQCWGGCGPMDGTCICSNTALVEGLSCCVSENCAPEGIQVAVDFARNICQDYGVTLTQTTAECEPTGVPTPSLRGCSTTTKIVSVTPVPLPTNATMELPPSPGCVRKTSLVPFWA